MIKKIIATALCAVLSAGAAAAFTACDPGDKLPPRAEHVKLTKDGVSISWDKVEGADRYEVYHSPSRFGEYKSVSSQSETVYNGTDKYGYYRVVAVGGGEELSERTYSYEAQTFGENVHIYSPDDDMEAVGEDIKKFTAETGQFYGGRYAALFKKGDYSALDLRMRYYMTFSGLGELPTDTVIGGFNTYGELAGGNATCNFWCGIENLSVDDTVQWAVSQATSFRRMNVEGGMYLTDRTGNKPWASGGFIADSKISGTVDAGGQQQWFTRNSEWGKWKNGDINMVYSGCTGAFDNGSYVWPSRWVTELEVTGRMSEKPYLVFDGEYYVCVPRVKSNSKGISWGGGADDTDYYPLEGFYVAQSDYDTAYTLNLALKKGKHILFTPGVYELDSPLEVNYEDTVILGLGLATLKASPENSLTLMKIADVDGVSVSGVMFDAGVRTQSLMEVGDKKTGKSHAENPVVLHDLYFRIGGAAEGQTFVDKTLVINSNDVIGDNFWVWRADHGVQNSVGWDVNVAINGLIVNGDNVSLYGLMVEHFEEYQTIWNGENGLTVFYQSETPYDPPEQGRWMSEWRGVEYEGYASYKVSDHVNKHTLYGAGVYYVASNKLQNVFYLDHGIELPSNAGIHAEHLAIANFLSFGGGIRHIINEHGEGLIPSTGEKKHFTSFIGGVAVK